MKTIKTELPRERFKLLGVKPLLTEELIAIILKTGSKSINVMDLSRNIVNDIKDISNFRDISLNKLMSYDGVGTVKAMELLSAIELGRRIYEKQISKIDIKLNNAQKVYCYMRDELLNLKQECFYVLFLDNKKNLINKKLLFKGTVNQTLVHSREIYSNAYKECASSIVCVHNHPSGDKSPSNADIEVTKNIIDVGNVLGIPLNDHIIITPDNYFSFYESGYI